jgi:hypothetical protein
VSQLHERAAQGAAPLQLLRAFGLRAQRRSRAVLRQSKVVAARLAMAAPQNKKISIAAATMTRLLAKDRDNTHDPGIGCSLGEWSGNEKSLPHNCQRRPLLLLLPIVINYG